MGSLKPSWSHLGSKRTLCHLAGGAVQTQGGGEVNPPSRERQEIGKRNSLNHLRPEGWWDFGGLWALLGSPWCLSGLSWGSHVTCGCMTRMVHSHVYYIIDMISPIQPAFRNRMRCESLSAKSHGGFEQTLKGDCWERATTRTETI